ncbi:ABC transporter ATP-binding protein [Actinomycetota bacterium]
MELIIDNVSKLYKGKIWGLKGFSIKINTGILGLLGPNGAGKSTLMRILATITKPTEGNVNWNGIDILKYPNKARVVLGYLPQDFGIYPNLSAIEFLEYIAAIKGLYGREARKRIDDLLQILNLNEVRKQPLSSYSGGMKQRIGIAQALLNDPKLLIVDEPTAGLDPEERIHFRNILADLPGERIVILSTHIVSDIEASATSIAIINKGKLVIYSSPEKLISQAEEKVWELNIPSKDLTKIKDNYLISSSVQNKNGVQIRIIGDNSPARDARPVSPNLEDSYLYFISTHRKQK